MKSKTNKSNCMIMKKVFLYTVIFLLKILPSVAQSNNFFDNFIYNVPGGFALRESNGDNSIIKKLKEINYCQLFLYPAVSRQSDVEKDLVKTGISLSAMQIKKLSAGR